MSDESTEVKTKDDLETAHLQLLEKSEKLEARVKELEAETLANGDGLGSARERIAELEGQLAFAENAGRELAATIEQLRSELERARKTIESSAADGLIVGDGIQKLQAELADAREALAKSGLPADEALRNELKTELYARLHTDPLVSCGRKMRAALPASATEVAREFDSLVQPLEARPA